MNSKTATGILNFALLSLVVIAGAACSNYENNETETPVAAASAKGAAAQALPRSEPVRVALDDGPVGVEGSRFSDPDVEVSLTAEVVQWEVLEGEFVEVWGYNGQYPGPEIRAKIGDKVRINFTNNLPEATAIHWHGLEVPNDQDGVSEITQPDIPPGRSWTYEFVAPRSGTTMYHTHSNTVNQLSKGLFGAFIVEPRNRLPQYDREYTLLLHEIRGFYTINGHSYPKTLGDSLMKIRSDEKTLVRLINAGQIHHPMHLHGHQFTLAGALFDSDNANLLGTCAGCYGEP